MLTVNFEETEVTRVALVECMKAFVCIFGREAKVARITKATQAKLQQLMIAEFKNSKYHSLFDGNEFMLFGMNCKVLDGPDDGSRLITLTD